MKRGSYEQNSLKVCMNESINLHRTTKFTQPESPPVLVIKITCTCSWQLLKLGEGNFIRSIQVLFKLQLQSVTFILFKRPHSNGFYKHTVLEQSLIHQLLAMTLTCQRKGFENSCPKSGPFLRSSLHLSPRQKSRLACFTMSDEGLVWVCNILFALKQSH